MNDRVSVIIPACNERFLQATVDGLLANAVGDVEVFPALDGGPMPNPPLKEDPRVKPVRFEKPDGSQTGMREVTNAIALNQATGRYLMKCDAHCIFGPGWDAALKADCDDDWVAVPTRHSINGETWTVCGRGGSRLDMDFGGVNYHYLTFPYAKSMYGYGLHGKEFGRPENAALNRETVGRPIDDLMSFQGSCWFTPLANFKRLGPLDAANYYFYSESIEVGMRQWASGGRVVINKKTWYAHYHKGQNNLHTYDGRVGRGFFLNINGKRRSEAFATDFWMNDRWPNTQRTFEQFIAKFWPLLQRIPADEVGRWPTDWNDRKYRFDFLNRAPEEIPAHI